MCLPRKILDRIVDEFLVKNKKLLTKHIYFINALQDLKQKPTYDQTYSHEEYLAGLKKGKATVERLDRVRGTDIKKILSRDKEILEWWTSI